MWIAAVVTVSVIVSIIIGVILVKRDNKNSVRTIAKNVT